MFTKPAGGTLAMANVNLAQRIRSKREHPDSESFPARIVSAVALTGDPAKCAGNHCHCRQSAPSQSNACGRVLISCVRVERCLLRSEACRVLAFLHFVGVLGLIP